MRNKAKVASEYDSYQQNQYSICRKNVSSSLAIRPPSETMRLYRAGPRAQRLPGGQDSDVFAIYEDAHAQCFEAAGYIAIHVRHFQPGVPLPIDLVNSLPSEGAGATMALSSAQRRIFAMSPTSERMCREPHLGAATSSFPWKPNPVSCLWASDVLQQFLPLTQHLSSQAL